MKKVILFFVSVLFTVAADAQTMEDYFRNSPEELFGNLNMKLRKEMCENIAGGISVNSPDAFGDSVVVHRMTDTYMSFHVTGLDVQMKIMDKVILVAKTCTAPMQDTELLFYNTEWKLKSSWIFGVRKSNFMPSDDILFQNMVVKPETMSEKEFDTLKTYFDPVLVEVKLSENENEITLKPYAVLLNDEEKARVEPLLKQKTFKWNGKKFK